MGYRKGFVKIFFTYKPQTSKAACIALASIPGAWDAANSIPVVNVWPECNTLGGMWWKSL